MIKDILQEGFVLKSKGYYKHSIELFYKALELDNSSVELLYEIAENYYLMRDEERALSYLEQVLDVEPLHIDSMKLLKKIFRDKKSLENALQIAENIYKLTNSNSDLLEILSILNCLNRYNEVLGFQTDCQEEGILYEICYANLFLGNLDIASEISDKLLNFEKSNKNLLLKGKILYKKNQIDECLNIVEQFDIEELDSDMLNFIGLIYQQKQEFKKALNMFKKAIIADDLKDEYYYNCASTYFKMGEVQEAKRYYNLAILKNPDNQAYRLALANLLYSEKHYKRALEELTGDFFEARLLKMIILYDSGYLSLAKKANEELFKESSKNELVLAYKAKIEKDLQA